ncbi:MAG TPA: hypothetical protein VE225_06100, partial [Rubrobacteraceae bacterium]|nr:hypothetical protein [Rubrobacteraceae bacterium]
SALGWRPELADRTEEGRMFRFDGPLGDVTVELSPNAPDTAPRRIRLYSGELTFRIEASRHGEHTDACSTVLRDGEPIGERTVHLGSSEPGVLLGEELQLLGRDETYESALERAVEMLGS